MPINCVEGWSVGADWRGLPLLEVVQHAGGTADSRIQLISIEQDWGFNHSFVEGPQLSAALLATHLNGQRLDIDHGYPLRLISPNRAGVLNTEVVGPDRGALVKAWRIMLVGAGLVLPAVLAPAGGIGAFLFAQTGAERHVSTRAEPRTKPPHSGRLSAGPPMRYGVSNPSYMRWAIMPSAACLRLWQWSIQTPGLFAAKAIS